MRPHVYVHSHDCLYVMLIIIGIQGLCSMPLQVCSPTFILRRCCCWLTCNRLATLVYVGVFVIVVAIVLVNCFHVNDIRSFRVAIYCLPR